MRKRQGALTSKQNNPQIDTQARAVPDLRGFDNIMYQFVKYISRANMTAQRDISARAVS